MPLRLRDHLHWCECAGHAVFLDAEADRYFSLPRAANEPFLRLAQDETRPGDVDRLRMLVARGILIETEARAPFRRPPTVEPALCDRMTETLGRPGLAWILRALAAERRAARLLRTKSLLEVLDIVSNRTMPARPARATFDHSPEMIVSAAAAASLITGVHDRCLVRALAVHSTCRGTGIGSTLVFGVTFNPFAAHCWVQLGSSVLVGGSEQARLFTPILVVE